MGTGYCQFCDKIVSGTGKTGRNCPTCGALLSSVDKAKKKDESPEREFNQGFSVNLAPEETLRLKKLKEAGLIHDATDVMRQGLIDMESRYIPHSKIQQQYDTQKVESFNDLDKALNDIEIMFARKLKIQNMKELMSGNNEKKEDSIPMEKMMQMMMLKDLMKGHNSDNSELSMIKMQLQQKEMQLYQQQFDNKIERLISEINKKGSSDDFTRKELQELQQRHEQKMQELKIESDRLRDEKYQQMLNLMNEKIKEKGQKEGWTDKIQEIITNKAAENLTKIFERGITSGESPKSNMDYITEIIGNVTNQIAPAINAWASKIKKDDSGYSPQPAPIYQAPQNPQPTPIPENSPSDSFSPLDDSSGNAVSFAGRDTNKKTDSFS